MDSACIFISYRRTDAGGYAGRIYDRLTSHFGPALVFMDTAAIPPGADFMQLIEMRIASSSAFVIVIGDDWLAADHTGASRIEDPNDPVRLEVEFAMRSNVRIFPVLVGRARILDASHVPATVKQIASLNAISMTHEMFEESMWRLIRALEPLVGSPKPSKKAANVQGGRRVLRLVAVAVAATATTVWLFEALNATRDIPFNLGETLFVFLVWLGLAASISFIVERLRK
jgi:hypothetical protein